MNAINEPQSAAANVRDPWRPLRYSYRVPLLVIYVVVAVPLALLLANPLGAKIKLGRESLNDRAIRYWSNGLCRIFGLRVKADGPIAEDPVMLVCNHLSWIDIQVIHSQRCAVFVGKSEIAKWPVFGWMAKAGGTVFLRRGSADSLNWVAERLADKLKQGLTVAIFPEAGTGDGLDVRRFYARLLKAAVLAEKPIQPVALRYVHKGRKQLTIPFAKQETLVANMWRILAGPSCEAQLRFLAPIEVQNRGRKEIAQEAENRVRNAYHEGLLT